MKGNVWFKCVGCGEPAAYFGDGLPPHYPPGAVGHSKPNAPGARVSCPLFIASSAFEFRVMNEHAERIENPTTFTPILG